MKFIRKALWPTAIVAAFLMLFGALGSAVNADKVTGTIQKDGDTIYVVVEVTSDLPPPGPSADDVKTTAAVVKARTEANAAQVASRHSQRSRQGPLSEGHFRHRAIGIQESRGRYRARGPCCRRRQ